MQAPLGTACPSSPGVEQMTTNMEATKNAVFIRPILLGLREQSRYTWFANRWFKKG